MNMLATIIPKSDQINADDLVGRDLTITITKVDVRPGEEQPVTLHYEGDEGRPYKACKSMRRVLVQVWGPDANAYIGRSMTLYRDPEVMFGGMKVGGIRISHMSHLDKPVTMALTATRANRKPFTVRPLATPAPQPAAEQPADKMAEAARRLIRRFVAAQDIDTYNDIIVDEAVIEGRKRIAAKRPELDAEIERAREAALARIAEQPQGEAA